MTAKPVVSIEQLLRASSDDEVALQYPLPDSGFGFMHSKRWRSSTRHFLLFTMDNIRSATI